MTKPLRRPGQILSACFFQPVLIGSVTGPLSVLLTIRHGVDPDIVLPAIFFGCLVCLVIGLFFSAGLVVLSRIFFRYIYAMRAGRDLLYMLVASLPFSLLLLKEWYAGRVMQSDDSALLYSGLFTSVVGGYVFARKLDQQLERFSLSAAYAETDFFES